MDICGEHSTFSGGEIAYAGRDCPACDQIEDINKEHGSKVSDLEDEIEDLGRQLDEAQEKITELQENQNNG